MINIGKTNKLRIIRDTPVGMFLGEDETQVVLLPRKFIKPDFEVGMDVDVFIYKDSEDRLIATTQEPYVQINQFACLDVVQANAVGAFMDWGLDKDLFVPFKEQKHRMREGYAYVVYVYLDDVTQRIVASGKINRFIGNDHLTVQQGDEVDLMVYHKSDLGFNCIINNRHKGLLYHNDIYQPLDVGDQVKGYIKLIRDNNLIDLSLQNLGFKHVLSSTDMILEYLKQHEGFLDLTDKSSPEIIMERFNMSKATFKKSIGILYRQRKVRLEENGVFLLPETKESTV